MVRPLDRVSDAVSETELERRWTALREVIRDAGVDALLAQGANHVNGVGGYSRWITGGALYGSYPETTIFPKDGLMVKVGHGPFGGEADFGGRNRTQPGTGRRLSTPTFPAISYCDAYDAGLIAKEVRRLGLRRIGLVGPGTMYWGFANALFKLLDDVEFTDVTDAVDHLRADKSPEEIDLMRRAAKMQDDIFAKVPEFLQPGLRDYQLMAHGQFHGALQGGASGYFLGGSAPVGEPAGMNPRQMQGRVIQDGDVVVFQPENSGPGGYFVHACRIYVLGKAPQELVDRWGDMVEAQDFTVGLLQNGADCAEIFRQYNDYMQARGFPPEDRLFAHSQGYDVVERPLIRQDERMAIGPTMNIGIHPRYANERVFVTVCDNFLTHASGPAERLHRTPREIFEL